MTAELRWILLIIGCVFVVALALWERRRPRQAHPGSAPDGPVLRESRSEGPRVRQEPRLTLPEIHPRAAERGEVPVIEIEGPEEELGAAEPATDEVPVLEPVAAAEAATAADEGFAAEPGDRPGAVPARVPQDEELPRLSARDPVPAPAGAEPVVDWPPDNERRIVALRLVAPQPQRFPGRSLRQALAAEGFVLGRFAIFHKGDEECRAVLSAASLNRPGTFDPDTMDSQQYGGLSLFAVLPGPKPPPQAFDELVFTARNLNERLNGVLQDEQGGPLTPARIATLRERIASGAAS